MIHRHSQRSHYGNHDCSRSHFGHSRHSRHSHRCDSAGIDRPVHSCSADSCRDDNQVRSRRAGSSCHWGNSRTKDNKHLAGNSYLTGSHRAIVRE